jgi:prophage DNA circulation protein
MYKADAAEAAKICSTVLKELLAQGSISGPGASAVRTAVSLFRVNMQSVLMADAAGPYLENIFRLAQANGITFPEMDYVRGVAAAQRAVSIGAVLIRDALVLYALATEAMIIAAMAFVSRDDVEAMRLTVNAAFAPMEETIADAMDQAGYQTLVACHAAINHHLTQTAMPLPRMLNFQFAAPLSTLVAAYKLYADAGRADELRDENGVVHPAFMLPLGRALSQ